MSNIAFVTYLEKWITLQRLANTRQHYLGLNSRGLVKASTYAT